jgi:hypothetical protein
VVLGYFERRFGMPVCLFAGYRLLERSKVYVILRDSSHLDALAFLKVQNVGFPVLRKVRQHLKPTTAVLQGFGQAATRHTIDLSSAQMAQLFTDRRLPYDLDWEPGYVILRHDGEILGCGVYTPGWLHSQIPQRLSTQQRSDLF